MPYRSSLPPECSTGPGRGLGPRDAAPPAVPLLETVAVHVDRTPAGETETGFGVAGSAHGLCAWVDGADETPQTPATEFLGAHADGVLGIEAVSCEPSVLVAPSLKQAAALLMTK